MSAHAVNVHAGSSGAGVCWYPEMADFGGLGILTCTGQVVPVIEEQTWPGCLWFEAVHCGSRVRYRCRIWISVSRVEFCAFCSQKVGFNVRVTPPAFSQMRFFCDLTCVHFKFDYLLKGQCSVALHEGCFRGVLAGVFPMCGHQGDFIDAAPGNGDLLSSKLEAACKFNKC